MLESALVAISVSVSGVITPLFDREVFSSVPHTLLDFETRGDGVTPIDLFPQSAVFIDNNEYVSNGILFSGSSMAIIRFSENTAVWEAFLAQSSPENALDASNSSTYTINFLNEIHSVGFEMVFGNIPGVPPHMQAFDILDNFLGEVVFDSTFIDGTTGLLDQNGFGFMGLSSSTPIAKITFSFMLDAVIDDLHFSSATIPAPGVLTLALPMALVASRRRQQTRSSAHSLCRR